MNSLFTLGLMIGISVNDLTVGTTIANLGMEEVKFPHPLFEGDTVHCTTEILGKRESNSRPGAGIVHSITAPTTRTTSWSPSAGARPSCACGRSDRRDEIRLRHARRVHRRRFTGNPLAVVFDADELDGAAMQAIAREFGHPETVFVLKPEAAPAPRASASSRQHGTPVRGPPDGRHRARACAEAGAASWRRSCSRKTLACIRLHGRRRRQTAAMPASCCRICRSPSGPRADR